jgi:hypothetical protein
MELKAAINVMQKQFISDLTRFQQVTNRPITDGRTTFCSETVPVFDSPSMTLYDNLQQPQPLMVGGAPISDNKSQATFTTEEQETEATTVP